MIINPKQRPNMATQKRVVSILNEIRNCLLGFYFHRETIFKMT